MHLPQMPAIASPSQSALDRSQDITRTQRLDLAAVVLPNGTTQSSHIPVEGFFEIKNDPFVGQILSQDTKQNFVLTSYAHRPIDLIEPLSKSTYAISVTLYGSTGQHISSGTGNLQLDLANEHLAFQSNHLLDDIKQLHLNASGRFDEGQVSGSLQSALQLNLSIADAPQQTMASTLHALRTKDEIVGSLATDNPNPHFAILGFMSKSQ